MPALWNVILELDIVESLDGALIDDAGCCWIEGNIFIRLWNYYYYYCCILFLKKSLEKLYELFADTKCSKIIVLNEFWNEKTETTLFKNLNMYEQM